METIRTETISGVNRFIEDQRGVPGEARITLVQFDDRYEPVINAAPIRDARPLTAETFVPRGNTCLFGAIGRTIDDTGKRFSEMPEGERPGKVVFVIVTDGEENSSPMHEWSRAHTSDTNREKIERQTQIYKWQFVYIGANQDAILNAAAVGIAPKQAMNYTANAAGTEALYMSASSNLRAFRMNARADMAWSDEDRAKQEAAKL